MLGERIPDPGRFRPAAVGWWPRLRRYLAARTTWQHFGYALLRLPLSCVQFIIVLTVWPVALALLATPAYYRLLPRGSRFLGGTAPPGAWEVAGLTAGGLILLLLAPQVTRGLAVTDALVARVLLGPPKAQLQARIGELERSRAAVVDSAEAERRRIERDLHDGAQQRLVALAMDLGRAKARFADDPEAARAIVDQAHAEAKAALVELRNLVRGVHPPVLTDRGLDAALSGLAALSPVPVSRERRRACPAVIVGRGDRLLRRGRSAHERGQACARHPGRGLCRPPRGHAQRGDQRQRGRRRRPARAGAGRPGRPGGRGGRPAVGAQPGRGRNRDRGGAAMRVVIAEDSVLLREGLTRLLAEAGHEVVAAAAEAEEFLRAVGQHEPDVVVVDVRMPPTFTDEGLRAALVVRTRWPGVGVLVLSQYVEERYATELLSDRPHGVGYLLKDRVADLSEFLDALDRVAAGGSALDPEVVAQLLARSRHPLAVLTAREREVLALMAEGRSNAAIAAALVVGEGAVEKHINSIFAKLGLAPTDRDHRRVRAVLRYLGAE